MARGICRWIVAGALALATLGPARAQALAPVGSGWIMSPAGLVTPMGIRGYTRPLAPTNFANLGLGMLSPFGYQPPSIPTDYVLPAYPTQMVPVAVPQPVYVPVAVPQERPPVQTVRATLVTLDRADRLPSIGIQQDTVVTWTNPGDKARTLVVDPVRQAGVGPVATRLTGVIPPNGSYSLAFNQPGTYAYYLEDQPDRRARIAVSQ